MGKGRRGGRKRKENGREMIGAGNKMTDWWAGGVIWRHLEWDVPSWSPTPATEFGQVKLAKVHFTQELSEDNTIFYPMELLRTLGEPIFEMRLAQSLKWCECPINGSYHTFLKLKRKSNCTSKSFPPDTIILKYILLGINSSP